jgi:2-hydroxy-6-oxonona-2,4-dienedioate hydrolase
MIIDTPSPADGIPRALPQNAAMLPWPPLIETLADVTALEAASRIERTPCGKRSIVWHVWGDGEPVVLLHGGAGSWTHWVRNVGALLDAGRRVFVPDMPGFGDSASAPGAHDADGLPPWIEQGLDALLGDERVDLVGFSFGGLVGGLFAARYPRRVRCLVLAGAPALSAEPMVPLDLRPWRVAPVGPARDAIHRHNLAALMLSQPASVDALAVALHAANVERDRMLRRRLMRTDLLLRTLPEIACPVAGIWGHDDVLYRGRTTVVEEAFRQARKPRSLVFVPGAGHWVQNERHEAFDAALLSALQYPQLQS